MKGALFLLARIVFNRYGTVDEVELHGRGRRAWLLPWSFMPAGLALAGAPPFGTGLGKAISEEALGHRGYWFGPLLFVAVSTATGGALLRAGARIWFGLGTEPHGKGGQGGPGESEDQDTREMPVEEHHVRGTPLAPLALLLATALAVGAVPAVPRAVSRAAAGFLDVDGYVRQALEGTPASPRTPCPKRPGRCRGSSSACSRRHWRWASQRSPCGDPGCRGRPGPPPTWRGPSPGALRSHRRLRGLAVPGHRRPRRADRAAAALRSQAGADARLLEGMPFVRSLFTSLALCPDHLVLAHEQAGVLPDEAFGSRARALGASVRTPPWRPPPTTCSAGPTRSPGRSRGRSPRRRPRWTGAG
ncbi:MAG: hypothetical protein M3Q47_02500, partial [Actinomycetota bacterium]|nr:hypothetical protein [Actinomycetota bacterium]